ncbi:MAG: T9SS type A sorting domain-containing protein [Candidatus Marinimicrobia bacterium]|nr:T9SS type A sorting domain-containing protein [Candidatus Neomarinimicrobiota bacterium]
MVYKIAALTILLSVFGFAQITGLHEDFNDNMLTGWEVPAGHEVTYEITELDSSLLINYHRTASSWEWDNFNFTPTVQIDLTENPYLSLRVKSDVNCQLTIKPIYENDTSNWLQVQLSADNVWHTDVFQMATAPPLIMTRLYFYLDGGTTVAKTGTVYFDDLKVGDAVDAGTVDLAALEMAISAAKKLLTNTEEGDGEGQFFPGSKAILQIAVAATEQFVEREDLTAALVDSAIWSLHDVCTDYEKKVTAVDIGLIDSLATRKTRYLFANLDRLAQDYFMFGMHDATGYGVGWSGDDDRSDLKDVCGSYPAVYSWDANDIARRFDVSRLRYRMISAFERGGINTLCWHQYDPLSRSFYQNNLSGENIVKWILPGGGYHDFYKEKLYRIALFCKSLRGSSGESIPIIFRPYHEHTGGWFWWGDGNCTTDQYNQIWQFTVEYLRDSLNVHNLLYALSPAASDINSKDDYYEIFPGADYIDIFGIDSYFGSNIIEADIINYQKCLRYTVEAAQDFNKVAALTEVGQESIPTSNFFTRVLFNPIVTDSLASYIAYAAVWRNANSTHHYAPYPGHLSVPDFLQFFTDPRTLFEMNLPQMYQLATQDSLPPQFASAPVDFFIAVDTIITVEITTDERAFLRYSVNDIPYHEMTHEFSDGQGTMMHSHLFYGDQGGKYTYYITAADYMGNVTEEPLVISFRVDTLQRPVFWHNPAYPLTDWKSGAAPFVFSGQDEGNTLVEPCRTVYYCKTFTFENATAQSQLIVFPRYDNGYVMYLNGNEVDRVDMPESDISYETWANPAAATYTSRTLTAEDCQYLVDGENQLAVEIHQAMNDTSDHLFDLKMIAPATLIDYGDEWFYYDDGRQPPDRTVGSLDVLSDNVRIPEYVILYPNYPNPFNSSTTIRYYLPEREDVIIAIYDLLGCLVQTLLSENQSAGLYTLNYNASRLSSGIYFLIIKAGRFTGTRKIILLK